MNKKNYNRISLKVIMSILALFILSINLQSREIHSTKEGGDWGDKETWVNGTMPFQGDNVIIYGNVKVTENSYCDTLTIELDCQLEISPDIKLTCTLLTVKKEEKRAGILDNRGSIVVGKYKINMEDKY